MTLILVESFDHQDAAGMLAKGWNRSQTPTGTGRFGGKAWSLGDRSNQKALPVNAPTVIVGAAYQYFANSDAPHIFSFLESGANQISLQYSVGSSTFSIVRGDSSVIGTFVMALTYAAWYYIEFKFTIHDTSGSAEFLVDGDAKLTLTSVDTKNTSNAWVDAFRIGRDGGAGNVGSMDDLYICDDQGSVNNDYLGDVRIEALFPSGNGNSSQFVGSDSNSTDNYLLVDENPENGDTDYVESATVGNKDTYAFGNLTPASGTVYGLQVNMYARKTDAGARRLASVARLSGTEVDSADAPMSATYVYQSDIRETKPGGGAWTIADVNNAEFGPKVTA